MKTFRLLLCLLLVMTTSISASAAPTVGIRDNSPIDIIFTGDNYTIDFQAAKTKLLASLEAAGVDISRVNIDAGSTTTISSEGSGAQEIVDTWKAFPEGKAGQSTIMDGAMMIGPTGGGPAGMYDPKLDEKGDVEIDFTFQTTCVPYSPAVLLRWRQDPATGLYSGYIVGLSTNRHAHELNFMPVNLYIWKVTNSNYPPMGVAPYLTDWNGTPNNIEPNNNLVAFSETGYKADGIMASGINGCSDVQHLYYAQKFNYHVTMKDGLITFELNIQRVNKDLTIKSTSPTYTLQWEDKNPYLSGSVGFFSHNANAVGMPGAKFKITDVNDLVEVVRSPKWRPDSHKFIVDAVSLAREDFANTTSVGELTQRMRADNSYYIGWGTNDSMPMMNSFIRHNANNGLYVPVSSSSMYDTTARFIEPIVNKLEDLNGRVYLYQGKDYTFD